jgi:hypothetical protein
MNLKVGDIVKFRKGGKSPLYENEDDLFEIVTVVEHKRFYSGIGIILKSIPCAYCGHHSNPRYDLQNEEFDSGWFVLAGDN